MHLELQHEEITSTSEKIMQIQGLNLNEQKLLYNTSGAPPKSHKKIKALCYGAI